MDKQLDSLSSASADCVSGEDPWDGLLQSGCENLSGTTHQEAGSVQPLVFPSDANLREVYRWLRAIWAQDTHPPMPVWIRNPLVHAFEPSQALAFLLAKKWGCRTQPLAPRLYPNGGTLFDSALAAENKLPRIAELCQLALLWLLANEKEAAARLIRWLLAFAQEKAILSLLCPEKEYDEREGLLSLSLLFRAAGNNEKSAEFLRRAQNQSAQPIDPFFIALARQKLQIEIEEETHFDPDFGLQFARSKNMISIFSLTGWKSSMGAIQTGDVEIRAIGPQTVPLGSSKDFGICRIPDGSPSNGWTRCAALPEVWIEMKTATEESGCRLDLRFIGLMPEKPLAMVFYAKGQSCQVGSALFKPKSLSRFAGETNALVLKGKEGGLKLESALSHKVQVIPLAGEGCFWDAEFLISFEIHPVTASASFLFTSF